MILLLIPLLLGAPLTPVSPPDQTVEAEEHAVPEHYRAFLLELQDAVRQHRRDKIVSMVSYPLPVNGPREERRSYRNEAALMASFDHIFTPAVQDAILRQHPRRLFHNYRGAMVGNGQVWFEQICVSNDCRETGPVKIIAINR